MSAPSTTTTRDPVYASAPFDHPKADIILRSSDNVDFRVFKLFLSLASPFFETLFDIPQPAQASSDQEVKEGLVVIPMAENQKTLEALLRFCYPCTLAEDPQLEVFEDILCVLEAARKYTLDVIEKKIVHALSDPKILGAEPLRCFAIARRAQLQNETFLAAKYTLTQPLIPSWFEEINIITAADLLALLTYHQECGKAVYALRNDLSWIKTHYGSSQACAWLSGKYLDGWESQSKSQSRVPKYTPCQCLRSRVPRYALFESASVQWWDTFMEEVFVALRAKPCSATVESHVEMTIQIVKMRNCPTCSPSVVEGMRDFSDLLVKKVDEAVSQIRPKFYSKTKLNEAK